MSIKILFAAALAATLSAATHAQRFSPDSMDGAAAAPPVQIAVLGTPHLSGAPDGFEPAMLEPVLERLRAFAPTHIAVEAPPAEHLRFLQAEAARLPDLAEQFGGAALSLSEAAATTVGVDPYAAAARLDAEQDELDPVMRMILSARAGQSPRAAALWLSFTEPQRRTVAETAPALAEALDTVSRRRDETYLLGAQLAAQFDPDTIAGMDDWRAGDTFYAALPRLRPLMQGDGPVAQAAQDPALTVMGEMTRAMTSAEGVLSAYRSFNSDAAQNERAQAEWAPFLATRSDPEAARLRLAVWEARNLRMAGNIVELARGVPGARVLVIVGASHKPYLEAMLDRLGAVDIVSTEALLE